MERLKLCMDGGNVLRYHTYAHTHRQQTVSEHSYRAYHVAMFVTNGTVPLNVVHEILHHDVAEAHTGDTPFPAKASSHDLKRVLDSMEDAIREEYEMTFELTEDEHVLVKVCDVLEMGLYAIEQIHSGNVRYKDVATNVIQWFRTHEPQIVHALLPSTYGNANDLAYYITAETI